MRRCLQRRQTATRAIWAATSWPRVRPILPPRGRSDCRAASDAEPSCVATASSRYVSAGHARTIRTLQRYCASGHLDAQKIATTLGDKHLVTPASVARHLAQIEELAALDNVATNRDEPRHVAISVGPARLEL